MKPLSSSVDCGNKLARKKSRIGLGKSGAKQHMMKAWGAQGGEWGVCGEY